MIKTIAKNVFSNYVGIAGAIIIGFLLSPFLVHSLGDTQYGIWSVVSALTGYMALLDLGISSAIARYVSRYHALQDYKALNRIVASGFMVLLLAGFALVLISPWLSSAVVGFFRFEGDMAETVRLLIIIATFDIWIFVTTGLLVGAFYGYQRNEIINGVNLMVALLKAGLFYWALSSGHGLFAMGVISLIGNLAAGLVLLFAMRRLHPEVSFSLKNVDRAATGEVFNYSKFTFLAMVAMQLVYYSDAFVIGYFLTAAAITYYTIPWSLSEYTNKLILAIAQTFVPVFSEQDAASDNSAIYKTYITGTRFMLFVSNLICLGVLAVGDYFVALWMGEKYAVACSTLLVIMFVTQLIKGPQLLSYSILLGTSSHKKFSLFNIVFSLINLGLSIVFIQIWGLVGVALVTALTQVVFYGVITPVLTSRVIHSNLLHYYRDTHLRAIPGCLVLFFLLKYIATIQAPGSYLLLLGQALLAALAYGVVSFFTLLDSNEREFIATRSGGLARRIMPA